MQSSGKKSNIKSKKLNNNISSPLISSILNYLDSEISQKISFPLKDDFISEKNILGYLKKELDSIYSFVDKGASIKLIFNPNFIFKYLETLPNYITY